MFAALRYNDPKVKLSLLLWIKFFIGILNDLAKKTQVSSCRYYDYQETDNINSVQPSLKSNAL